MASFFLFSLASVAADDIATTKRVIDAQKGPVVVVGHSYGGAVITEAAAGNPNVKALVYVAGLISAERARTKKAGGTMAAGAIFELERLWKRARMWYSDRLDANSRRKTIPEREAILGAVGLSGPFWRLTEAW